MSGVPMDGTMVVGGCAIEDTLSPALTDATEGLLLRCGGPLTQHIGHKAARQVSLAALCWLADRTIDTEGNATPLMAILKAFNVSLEAFMREIPVALARAAPVLATDTTELQNRVRVRGLQSVFVYSKVLAKKTREMLATFIVIREPASDSYSPSLEDLHSFSWLLFLVAKHRLLPPDKDLVSLFSLLLPVIAAVYELVPLSCRLLIDNNQNAQSTGCLPALVQKFKGSPAEVLPLAQGLSIFLRDDLLPATGLEGIPSPRYSGPQHSPETVGAPDSLSAPLVGSQQIQGLFSNPGTLAAAIDVLDSMYGQIYEAAELRAGEIDERIFIHGGEVGTSDGRAGSDDGMGPARSAPDSDGGGGMSAPFSPVARRILAEYNSPAISGPLPIDGFLTASPQAIRPFAATAPPTPVTAALTAASWLRSISSESPGQPSAALLVHLEAAGSTAGPIIARRVSEAADALFPIRPPTSAAESLRFLHPDAVAERRTDGVKLYWLVLEVLVLEQVARGGAGSVVPLLRSDTFHRSLLALSFEMVIASYSMASLAFPAVLERLKLAPFDLSKLVQPFQRAVPRLPSQLTRHLFLIEERILESLAWERGSPIYPLLITATGGHLPASSRDLESHAGSVPPTARNSPVLTSAFGAAGSAGSTGTLSVSPSRQLTREISLAMPPLDSYPPPTTVTQPPRAPEGNDGGSAVAMDQSMIQRQDLGLRIPNHSLSARFSTSAARGFIPAVRQVFAAQSKGTAGPSKEHSDSESPPDSPVAGRLPIAGLALPDGGSPMTPRKARCSFLTDPEALTRMRPQSAPHQMPSSSLGLRAPSWGTDTKVDDEPESPTRVGITPPAVFSPLLSPRKQHVAHTLRPRTAPPLSAAMRQAVASESTSVGSAVHTNGQPPLPPAFGRPPSSAGARSSATSPCAWRQPLHGGLSSTSLSPSSGGAVASLRAQEEGRNTGLEGGEERIVAVARDQIAEFLARLMKLAGLRLSDLSSRLDCAPVDRTLLLSQVFTVVEQLVYCHTRLLYGRHLDQILLAALYGVCKVNGLKQMSFKEIIHHYRQQPQAHSDVFRVVVISQTDPQLTVHKTGDVIEFYNAVFVPEAKALLMRVSRGDQPLHSPPVLPPHLASLSAFINGSKTSLPPVTQAHSGSGGSDFSSPSSSLPGWPSSALLHPSTAGQQSSPFMTPRTKSLYAFVGDSGLSKAPTHVNQGLAAINTVIATAAAATTATVPAESYLSEDTHLRAAILPSTTAPQRQWSAGTGFNRAVVPAQCRYALQEGASSAMAATASNVSGIRALPDVSEDLAAEVMAFQSLGPATSPGQVKGETMPPAKADSHRSHSSWLPNGSISSLGDNGPAARPAFDCSTGVSAPHHAPVVNESASSPAASVKPPTGFPVAFGSMNNFISRSHSLSEQCIVGGGADIAAGSDSSDSSGGRSKRQRGTSTRSTERKRARPVRVESNNS